LIYDNIEKYWPNYSINDQFIKRDGALKLLLEVLEVLATPPSERVEIPMSKVGTTDPSAKLGGNETLSSKKLGTSGAQQLKATKNKMATETAIVPSTIGGQKQQT
jgi:hypothetical protein